MLGLLDVAGQAEAAARVINPEQFGERSRSVNVMAGGAFHLVRARSEERQHARDEPCRGSRYLGVLRGCRECKGYRMIIAQVAGRTAAFADIRIGVYVADEHAAAGIDRIISIATV